LENIDWQRSRIISTPESRENEPVANFSGLFDDVVIIEIRPCSEACPSEAAVEKLQERYRTSSSIGD
jgi:hypothetical protein